LICDYKTVACDSNKEVVFSLLCDNLILKSVAKVIISIFLTKYFDDNNWELTEKRNKNIIFAE